MKQRIETKLREGLSPTRLEIEDQSALHAGHAGARAGGESHFHVTVESAEFRGLGRVEQHRLIYALLSSELSEGLHALTLTTLLPGKI